MTITHNALDLTIQVLSSVQGLGPDPLCAEEPLQLWCWPWPPSDMDMFRLRHYEARMVGKQVVGILLEYFLVCTLIQGK